MAPFIPPEHEQAPEPAWESCKLHIAYYEKKMARQFTDETIKELEDATIAYHRPPGPPPRSTRARVPPRPRSTHTRVPPAAQRNVHIGLVP